MLCEILISYQLIIFLKHSDAYASIHKGSLRTMIPQTDTMAQRKIPTSKEEPISNSTYSNNRSPYDNNYSTYVKLPQQVS